MLIALKEMKWNKSPGPNGLSADFYKFFYKEIKNVLFEALNYAIQVGHFHTTSRREVISDSKSCLSGLNWPRSEKTVTFWHFFGWWRGH